MRYSEEQIEHYLSFLKPDKQQDTARTVIEELNAAIVDVIDSGRRWAEAGVRNVV